jgi:hypothetical protein
MPTGYDAAQDTARSPNVTTPTRALPAESLVVNVTTALRLDVFSGPSAAGRLPGEGLRCDIGGGYP